MKFRPLMALAALLVAGNAFAQLLTEKKFFTLPQYTDQIRAFLQK